VLDSLARRLSLPLGMRFRDSSSFKEAPVKVIGDGVGRPRRGAKAVQNTTVSQWIVAGSPVTSDIQTKNRHSGDC